MAGTTGLEPATSAVTGQRSNQLSYVPRMNLENLLHAADDLEVNSFSPRRQPPFEREAKLHPCFCNIIECTRNTRHNGIDSQTLNEHFSHHRRRIPLNSIILFALAANALLCHHDAI